MESSKKILSTLSSFFAFLISIIMIILGNSNLNCKNPKAYEPPFDSLYPPPEAPQLIKPKNDTVFWHETPHPHNVKLKWSLIEDIEYYQLQIANDSANLPNTTPLNVEMCSTTFSVLRNGFYYWRVRAYNRKWTWYTDWSDTWCFGSFYKP